MGLNYGSVTSKKNYWGVVIRSRWGVIMLFLSLGMDFLNDDSQNWIVGYDIEISKRV